MPFDDYLRDLHANDYHGRDDDMPDEFERWLTNLDLQDVIDYGNEYGEVLEKIIHERYAEVARKIIPNFKQMNLEQRIQLNGILWKQDPNFINGKKQPKLKELARTIWSHQEAATSNTWLCIKAWEKAIKKSLPEDILHIILQNQPETLVRMKRDLKYPTKDQSAYQELYRDQYTAKGTNPPIYE